ncbi:DsbA family protein [Saccharopolyspora sp. NPDC050389]|uniref:DsbA family protein n=1 Tax=Saccharopolyspora sp. NPDC050389 TaxID=3155516 RepID=UPI003411D3C7
MADRTFGVADGLAVDFESAVFTNTFGGHPLVAAADALGLAERMTERLFRAYYAEGLNIGDPDTLRRLAADVGVPSNEDNAVELQAELDRSRRLGVTSVPLFVFDDGTSLSGAQSEAIFLQVLESPSAA